MEARWAEKLDKLLALDPVWLSTIPLTLVLMTLPSGHMADPKKSSPFVSSFSHIPCPGILLQVSGPIKWVVKDGTTMCLPSSPRLSSDLALSKETIGRRWWPSLAAHRWSGAVSAELQ